MTASRHGILAGLAVAALVAAWPSAASAQWQIESKDGKSNIKFGFLVQPQLEILQTPDPTSTTGGTVDSNNLFFRRFRILFGGKVSDKWTFFLETDSPNLGKQAAGTTTKDAGFVYIQDAVFTYDHSEEFKVDVGLILLGESHNHLQSAASLLPVDYGPYTFLESGPMQERVGRDYGVEIRGYPFKQHFEYRLGAFEGLRGAQARNGIRVVGRAVYYPFASETGLFYTGTFQGEKRVVALGASFDVQNAPAAVAPATTSKGYRTFGLDAFAEEPINKGEQGVTAQFNWLRFDGGTLAPSLLKQNAYLVEAGFHFGKGRYTPFVQYAARKYVDLPTTPDMSYWQLGFAWWMAGHHRNLKFSAGREHTAGESDRTQVLAQLQLFFF